jgi:hypothetical protein
MDPDSVKRVDPDPRKPKFPQKKEKKIKFVEFSVGLKASPGA